MLIVTLLNDLFCELAILGLMAGVGTDLLSFINLFCPSVAFFILYVYEIV